MSEERLSAISSAFYRKCIIMEVYKFAQIKERRLPVSSINDVITLKSYVSLLIHESIYTGTDLSHISPVHELTVISREFK